jgi:hypothetical protein
MTFGLYDGKNFATHEPDVDAVTSSSAEQDITNRHKGNKTAKRRMIPSEMFALRRAGIGPTCSPALSDQTAMKKRFSPVGNPRWLFRIALQKQKPPPAENSATASLMGMIRSPPLICVACSK